MQVNQPTKKLRLFYKVAIALLIFTCNLIRTAYALPGQPIKSALQWAQNHPILPKLTYYNEAYVYSGQTSVEGGQLFFRISFIHPSGAVTEEFITYSRDNQPQIFTKTDSKALRLLERIYGRTVVDDFRNSQYVTQVGSGQFYKGQRFAYIADTGEQPSLTLTRLEDLAQEIRRARFCQAHDGDCDV